MGANRQPSHVTPPFGGADVWGTAIGNQSDEGINDAESYKKNGRDAYDPVRWVDAERSWGCMLSGHAPLSDACARHAARLQERACVRRPFCSNVDVTDSCPI